ncbi:hypothetical protein [Burkholderia sp. BE17]|nr:hypothetical protein [Burkholderia sp. BE17]
MPIATALPPVASDWDPMATEPTPADDDAVLLSPIATVEAASAFAP